MKSDNWVNTLIQYCKTGKPVACPLCGEVLQVLKFEDEGHQSVSFKCDKCGGYAHFDGKK